MKNWQWQKVKEIFCNVLQQKLEDRLNYNDKNQSFAWLEKVFAIKSSLMPTLINDIKWDEWRNDDRFKAILKKMNIT